jgi:hypothetical protein
MAFAGRGSGGDGRSGLRASSVEWSTSTELAELR